MKKQNLKTPRVIFSIIILFCITSIAQAQVFKGFGKKLEKKLEQRLERKADRQVDKIIDKADKKTDEPINDLMDGKSNKKTNTTLKESVDNRPDQTLVLIGSSCTDMSWFKKGAVLQYESMNDHGKVDGQFQMKVENITNKGTSTIAGISATLSSPHFDDLQYQMNYICDRDMIYLDIASLMKAMMENNPELKNKTTQNALKNTEINFNEGFASFPKKMHPGMKLEDLNFSFKTKSMNAEIGFNSIVDNRQVVTKETVKTPAGTFECLKIRSTTHTTMHVMGIKQKTPTTTDYMWFAPGIGMIKQETHQNGKITTSMRLKHYKL